MTWGKVSSCLFSLELSTSFCRINLLKCSSGTKMWKDAVGLTIEGDTREGTMASKYRSINRMPVPKPPGHGRRPMAVLDGRPLAGRAPPSPVCVHNTTLKAAAARLVHPAWTQLWSLSWKLAPRRPVREGRKGRFCAPGGGRAWSPCCGRNS